MSDADPPATSMSLSVPLHLIKRWISLWLCGILGMYKNQLQELAQRSCFNLPSYACIREGPDHAPRFKATVNFNGETFESPIFCTTLKQAEHAAAEVALNVLSVKGPYKALAARVLDETGVYKNLLQETAHRAGLKLPVYTTIRKGAGQFPVYSSTVELAGLTFMGESAKTKKQAQKNTAMAAWYSLKQMARSGSSPFLLESGGNDDKVQITVARFLSSLLPSKMSRLSHEDQINRWRGTSFCKRDVIPYASDRVQYTIQDHYQYSPEFTIYKMWAQEKSLQHQNHFLILPFQQTSHLSLQHFPSHETVFQQNLGQCFRPAEQEAFHFMAGVGPTFYVSNPLVPVPVSDASQVNIQEIEESRQVKENWFHANESCSHLGPVFPLASSKLCDTPTIVNTKFGETETGTSEINNNPQILHRSHHLKHSCRPQHYNRVCATARAKDPRPSIGNPPRPERSCRLVVSPENAGRPWPQNIHAANNMAPPVHIRTVVPVYSAPPRRRMETPNNNQVISKDSE